MAKTLQVSVVSAEAEVFSGEATSVVATTVEGEIGILAGHQPVLAVLKTGLVKITLTNGEKLVANATDGFLSVDHDAVTIVAGSAHLA